jgi:hypothetical protein
MIVRIMGEGQVEVGGDDLEALNVLDDQLEAAIVAGDEGGFRTALEALLESVRQVGKALPAESLEPSDLVLPPVDAAMEEVRAMLGNEGLIPD